jgi:hypothetical protein
LRFILAAEGSGVPLVLSRSESTNRRAELFDLPAILRPISSALRGYRAVIVRLRLPQELGVRA